MQITLSEGEQSLTLNLPSDKTIEVANAFGYEAYAESQPDPLAFLAQILVEHIKRAYADHVLQVARREAEQSAQTDLNIS